jgi:hypothetical protein
MMEVIMLNVIYHILRIYVINSRSIHHALRT